MMNLPVKVFPEIYSKGSSRLFVFAEARSGSNWLVETLQSHPDIFMLKEIMQPVQRDEYYLNKGDNGRYLDSDVEYVEKQLADTESTLKGCKILFPQAVRFMDLYEFIQNYRDAYFLLLRRKNLIKGEVSGAIARHFSAWHTSTKSGKKCLSIDPEQLLQRVQWRQLTTRFCSGVINAHVQKVKELFYEDIFDAREDTMKGVAGFLEKDPLDFSYSTETKMNVDSLKELIVNYKEVRDYFLSRGAFTEFFDC